MFLLKMMILLRLLSIKIKNQQFQRFQHLQQAFPVLQESSLVYIYLCVITYLFWHYGEKCGSFFFVPMERVPLEGIRIKQKMYAELIESS